ncbi:uroporphyrinogen-III C-methyltransferase [Lysobacter korlensis]|uniref:uroporphyrinogen-III C-methyltransferase n=1 Tax=Lysobacter korlensis TaxID=553636 RepID=A0ABV6RS28_9GAMM
MTRLDCAHVQDGTIQPESDAVQPDAGRTRAWLIGAGPGDVELLTLKATRALALADVVLVDDLVTADTLQFVRADAQVIYVGKRGGRASASQDEIIRMMLEHLRAGRHVARLKGGDPFVFGRGGEELQALRAAGVQAEVISGITAGIAAPTTIGIPVTQRDYAQGVIFVTGHSAGEQAPNWALLAASGMTLVIYMGITRIEEIAEALLAAAMNPNMPCAVIESATRPEQRHMICPLAELAQAVTHHGLGSPAIVVIGAVVGTAAPSMALGRIDAMA